MKRALMLFMVVASVVITAIGVNVGNIAVAADNVSAPASTATPASAADDAQRAKDEQFVALLMRLDNIDINKNEAIKTKVMGVLERNQGTQLYLDLVKRFAIKDTAPQLFKLALDKPDDTLGVEAARMLFGFGEGERFSKLLAAPTTAVNQQSQRNALGVIGHTSTKQAYSLLAGIASDDKQSKQQRTAAVNALGQTRGGERQLLALAKAGKLDEDMHFATGNVLFASLDEKIRMEAKKHIKLPASLNAKPLPPISELVKRKGNPINGLKVMKKTQCFICHRVENPRTLSGINEGKDVGPALSEIGSKLAADAMYVAILDPSAGIEHNYTAHHIETEDGEELVGIIISETKEKIVVRVAGGITHTFKPSDIYSRKALKSSLMPPNMQLAMTEQELVDLVAFLSALKKE